MFTPDRHTKLDARWDSGRAASFIEDLFNRTEQIWQARNVWPAHPDDGKPPNGTFFTPLYHGLAGVIWTQLELAESGYGPVRNDYLDVVEQTRLSQQKSLRRSFVYDNKDDYLNGLLIAELGFLVPLLRLDPSPARIDLTIQRVRENLHNSILELLWGSPGSMLLLVGLLDKGLIEQRHADLLVAGVTFLKEALVESTSRDARVWQQNLYGEQTRLLGAGHGFAGNALAIMKSLRYMDDDESQFWKPLIRHTMIQTADRQTGFANWRQSVDIHREGRADWLVQFCHGAAGVVSCLAELMGDDDAFDQLMLEAGELVWSAGPLAKGGGFCHGTAGNGWTFLKLFSVTGDERWLDRATRFAAHAIDQSEQRRQGHGDYRYSLWTGDQGIALFADACLSHNFKLPTLERF